MGPRFKVSSERQLIFVKLTSIGIEPTTSNFQVEHSIQLNYTGWLKKKKHVEVAFDFIRISFSMYMYKHLGHALVKRGLNAPL